MSCQQSSNSEEQTFEKEFNNYKENFGRIEKIKIQIKFTSDQKIIYSQNGAVLRVVEGLDVLNTPETFHNMDQLRNLSWQGQYDQNKKKDGKLIAFWNKAQLKIVGGYYKEGQKQGLWKDLFLNYSNEDQIYEIGEYYNGYKIGKWNYLIKKQKIEGGSYDKDGWKQGKWIELDEQFQGHKKVTYNGQYNKKGMKVGSWDVMFCEYWEKEYKQIIFKFANIYIVVVDHMIKKEIRKRLESGQNWMKILMRDIKSFVVENII